MTREELKKEAQEQVNYCTPLYQESFIQGYLAGAEPRENKIADLEKENAELKSIAEFQQSSNMKRHFEIQKLEKENAELKKRVDNLYNSDCWASDQLTKAKDLLRRFIKWARTEHCEKFDVILEQTEQFIKKIEKC